jgi:hypothetical protein
MVAPPVIPLDRYYTGSGGYGTLGKSLNDDNRMDEDDLRDQYHPSSLGDDDRSRSEYYSHCATTAPLTDDSAKLPNTLDVLADNILKSASKYSENDIEGPDLDSEHVHVVRRHLKRYTKDYNRGS